MSVLSFAELKLWVYKILWKEGRKFFYWELDHSSTTAQQHAMD